MIYTQNLMRTGIYQGKFHYCLATTVMIFLTIAFQLLLGSHDALSNMNL